MSKPQARNMREVQEEYKEKIVGLCIICQKPVPGYYGRYGDGGVCSKACMKVQDEKPKYPDHSEEDFLIRLSEKESDS